MKRIGQPLRLIAYDTEANIERRLKGKAPQFRFVRPRTILYSAVLVVVSAVMVMTLTMRHTLELDVLRDRNPEYVTLADGSVRNAYTIKLMNRSDQTRTVRLAISGLVLREINVIGVGPVTSPVPLLVEADKVRTVRVLLTVAAARRADDRGVTFTLADMDGKESRSAAAVFVPGDRPL
jgi:polyferredoxin